ncbi:MAG: DUF1080 domain-containing protein [Candidatus Hydrogenedentes bacterium]|nr:DUF1080 domain-containing protein [Candidatus Hydrogenedentota bacterium]
MNRSTFALLTLPFALALGLCAPAYGAGAENPFVGNWALTIPGGGAGWLGVTQQEGYLDASVLWGGGSVVPVDSVYMDGANLVVTRAHEVERKDKDGKVVRKQNFTDTITATVSGNDLKLTVLRPDPNGGPVQRQEFSGKRIPPVPAAPNLASLKFGAPIPLFNGKNLDGWELTNPKQVSGWKAKDGLLVNDVIIEEGKPHPSYGNLRTKQEFEDFNLKLEVQVPKRGNSGIYLRGIYEVQVEDTYGKPVDSHNMGGIYSRIAPTVAAEKPAGEWQSLDITLADRHVTVKLNGKTIIDNQPLLGCTGGALTSDEFKPGPIYLQGDHTGITYRNIVLTPIVK